MKPNETCEKTGMTRRTFLAASATVAGGALLATGFESALGLTKAAEAGQLTSEQQASLNKPENVLYSVCLQCNTGCSIKVKMLDGVAVKIDGSAYSPYNMIPSMPMSTPVAKAASIDAPLCPKGQAGLQVAYDPYRIRKVLKRAGKRGENKWVSIPFAQAVEEIVNGGKLFANVPGEESRVIEGMKDLYVMKDSKTYAQMAADAKALGKAKDKAAAIAEFKTKYAAQLDVLIDPNHPDLGPKNNQVVYWWGRKKAGRSEFFRRFFADYFGTVNTHGHTTVCQGSLYFTCKAMSEQYDNGKFSGGQKFYWQPDLENSKFVLFVGSNLFDANYGPTNRTPRLTDRLAKGEISIAVADPRFSKLASKAKYYLPVAPGADAALFMGIIRRIIDTGKYDAKFLRNANPAAAKASGELSWSNAPLLVKIGKDGAPGKFVRAHEVGLMPGPEKRVDKDGKEYEFPYLVAMVDGKPTAVDPNDTVNAVYGDLFVDTAINGVKVKSSLQVMAESSRTNSIEDWAKLAEVPAETLVAVADELAKYGKKAAVDVHRGIAQHTNGFYNVTAAMNVNLLLGNFDWKGGMIAASTYNITGGKETQPFNFSKMAPKKNGAFGISVIRHDVKYEETTLFKGYPAKRNWWPLASDIYEEILPSIQDAYPYGAKIVFGYMGAPNYSLPAGQTQTAALADLEKLPLYVASDITVGVTSLFADYIIPDLTFLERWEFQGSHPNMPAKVQPVRQPVIAPVPETVKVYGEEQPISFETFLMALAEKMNMPGFGKNAFGEGQHLLRPDDFYIRMVANVATDGTPLPDATPEEERIFLESRRHLPKSVFDADRWKAISGAAWPKVVTVLNRGGRFQDYKDIYKGEQVANKYGKLVCMYQEKTADTKSAFTGKQNPGYALYVPISITTGQSPEEAGLTKGYGLHLITQRDVVMTKSRTLANPWLLAVEPENHYVINPADAKKLGLKDGDMVKPVSATNLSGDWDLKGGGKLSMKGRLKVTNTVKPGVVTFCIGYGQWANGAADITVDGQKIKADKQRQVGFNANAAMWVDPYLKNTCMIDPVGGSVSFYDTKINLVKA